MSTSGGQPGNHNAEKRQWRAAIHRALEKRGSSRIEALDALAERLLVKAGEGDIAALKELGDRIEGRATQTIEATVTANLVEAITGLPTVTPK